MSVLMDFSGLLATMALATHWHLFDGQKMANH
jgi:hypothetical protein